MGEAPIPPRRDNLLFEMNDKLQQLLRETDRHAGANRAPSNGLADRVWQAGKRRRRVRRVAGGSLVAMLMVAGIWFGSHRGDEPQIQRIAMTNPTSSPVSVDRESRRREIALHEAAVQRLLAAERLGRARARLAEFKPAPNADAVVEQAAAVIVFQTQRSLNATGETGAATARLKSVIENFPDTASARLARQQLELLQQQG